MDYEIVALYPFRGAVEGVVIQQVEVLPEELTVHLGSYLGSAQNGFLEVAVVSQQKCNGLARPV